MPETGRDALRTGVEGLTRAPFSPTPGTRISHYEISGKLGAGGMGAVYAAHDDQLDRTVAIKFLKASTDPRARRRLLREARAAAALDHPSICAVYDVGTDPHAGDFIVMQYLDGDTLADRLLQGPLRVREALAVGRHLAEALGVAHRHGIVHRDLKPQNVIIDRSGRPRLLDFGIARAVGTGHADEAAHATTRVTEADAVIGTPPYMSPEQIQGAAVDARSDLFSLGCVLYECLTGERAFGGATGAEVCGAVLHVDPPAPSARRTELTAEHDAICLRLLQKEPAERFQSADEVVGALRMLEDHTGQTGTGTRGWKKADEVHAWGSPWLRVVLGVVLVLTAGVLLLGWMGGLPSDWHLGQRLPDAPVEARRWYDQGIQALRNGTYATARSRLEEAIRVHPTYALAHARLAEAYSELDDLRAAETMLLKVSAMVPNQSALDEDAGLRLTAVRASVLRQHGDAEAAYEQLARRHAGDSGAWVDLARAQDAAGRWGTARETLGTALSINHQDAAAHLHLGMLEGRLGQKARALAALEEAERLYRADANVEGEVEALLRRGMVLSAVGDLNDAQQVLERVDSLTSDPRHLVQRLRARFELAALASSLGRPTEAEQLARAAVADARDAGLETVAANGLIDLADALLVAGQHADADEQLERAIRLTDVRGARHTAMRARLQQAALRQTIGAPQDALRLAEAPLQFFAANGYTRWEALARTVVSRAHESLEQYADASALAADVLAFAESVGDESLQAGALENLAGQLASLGRLPEALAHRKRIERIHRQQDDQYSLPFDLVNRAELLIRLGRGPEAEVLLTELDEGIQAGRESYVGRGRRGAVLRALQAATEGRHAEVPALAAAAVGTDEASGDFVSLLARALNEYARARLGRRGASPAVILAWGANPTSPGQRELRYWVARTLVERGRFAEAETIVTALLAAEPMADQPELRWRLAATGMLTRRGTAPVAAARQWQEIAARDVAVLQERWGDELEGYLRRADLAALRALVQ